MTEQLAFLTDLDAVGWPYFDPIFVPLSGYVLQGHLTHEYSILILLNIQIFQVLENFHLPLCHERKVR